MVQAGSAIVMLCVTSVGMHFLVGEKETGSDYAAAASCTLSLYCRLEMYYRKISASLLATYTSTYNLKSLLCKHQIACPVTAAAMYARLERPTAS